MFIDPWGLIPSAEEAAGAVATNRNCIIFNPATVNLGAYGLSADDYSASMTAYIVRNEPLHALEGWFSVPIGQLVYLDNPYQDKWYHLSAQRTLNSLDRHSM